MRSLNFKLTLAFVLVALVSAALAAVFIQWRTQLAFDRFLVYQDQRNLAATLAEYYEENGSWEGALPIFRRAAEAAQQHGEDAVYLLTDPNGAVIFGKAPETDKRVEMNRVAVEVDGVTVGWLLGNSRRPLWERDIPQQAFFQNINRALLWSTLGTIGLALVLGGLLANSLTRPLHELAAAARQIAQGRLGQQVPVRSQDEIGQLTQDFNQMSSELEKASWLRKQMTADIAHDLRTPLSIIRGYAEALADGKLPGSPEIYTNIHDAANHLSRLVDDLRTLSLSDAGELTLERQLIAPEALLQRAMQPFEAQARQKQITLSLRPAAAALPEISVDADRMTQVLFNLLGNALRHTPPGGQIECWAEAEAGHVLLHVRDSGEGISPQDLPLIFDRFYRADPARPQSGETGLGLTIARSLVEAHGGTIRAASTPGQGAIFTIQI